MGKKNVLQFFAHCFLLAITGSLIAACYIGYMIYKQDPLHLFHAPRSGELYLIPNMRIQAAGIINSFDFDSAILGTSVLENSSSSFMQSKLGGKFVNISLSGGVFEERDIVLTYLLKKKKIRSLVYSVDRYYLGGYKITYDADLWTYLYDSVQINDVKAYLSKQYLKNIFEKTPVGNIRSLDRPNDWSGDAYNACRFGGLQNWINNMDKQGLDEFLKNKLPQAAQSASSSNTYVVDKEKEKKAIEYIDKNIFKHVEKNKDTEFFLVFPPYWRFFYANLQQNDPVLFYLHQNVIRHMVCKAHELGNATIFGFEDCSFVDDIANFKDVGHFSNEINEYIAESMGKGEHLLTPGNVEDYLARCEELARSFDIRALNKKVQKALVKK